MKRRREAGQATVEFALLLPIVAVLILGLVQVGLVVAAQLSTTHLAHEIARVVAAEPGVDPGVVVEAVHSFGDRPSVRIEERLLDGTTITVVDVEVEQPVPSLVPGPRIVVSERVVVHRQN